MDMLQNYEELSITEGESSKFSGLAYDGHSFYLTLPASYEICEYNKKFSLIKRYKTQNRYTSLCYDPKDRCFWAASQDCYATLYRLSTDMQELELIRLKPCAGCGCVVNSISYSCKEDKLLVAFTNCVLLCDKNKEGTSVLNKNETVCFTQAFSISPFYGFTYLKGAKQYIAIMDDEYKSFFMAQIPSNWVIKGVTFFSDNKEEKAYLYFLVLKNNLFPCIVYSEILGSKIKETLWEYNNIPECCVPESLPESTPHSLVVESVALVESAINNVLNLEASKLQNKVEPEEGRRTALETSTCINNTIKDVKKLEQVLYNRLWELCDKYGIDKPIPNAEE